MTLPSWQEEPIAKIHNRAAFDCGDAMLNDFLQRHARQNHEKGGAKTFVAIDQQDGKRILGYYSLAPAVITFARTPAIARKGLARHDVPGYRLTRLATDLSVQGQGLGGQLLLLAGYRCLRVAQEVGGVLLIIDAKNERAASWYKSYGAIPLDDTPLTLVLPFETLEIALREVGRF